ncbi:armadillo-type protein [Jimgerdemannia flammicorona]|uniref:Armadillo-type protein n=1 Tax=Jimgerdemannia flammicorona TaxID=994334 RepID=A0A433AUB3_9FUNG|nr:armadillo-type protein [Jimgerdemannia flammicorona]
MDPLLLPRPQWLEDEDLPHCASCAASFSALKRRVRIKTVHLSHLYWRCSDFPSHDSITVDNGESVTSLHKSIFSPLFVVQKVTVGNIFCHDCSSRNVPLPQLGYGTKPVRVCNGCIEVAYLVTYAVDEDHGLNTQVHGARGLLEIIERDDESDLTKLVAYGGLDTILWLGRPQQGSELHVLASTALATLSEKESMRPILISKGALSALIALIKSYSQRPALDARALRSFNTQPSNSDSTLLTNISANPNESVVTVLLNSAHTIYQLVRGGFLSHTQLFSEGTFTCLVQLSSFELEQAAIAIVGTDKQNVSNSEGSDDAASTAADLQRCSIIQGIAAKAISGIAANAANQYSIIESVKESDWLATLLSSPNAEVRKYGAKTMAYLSLRNGKWDYAISHKSWLIKGDGAKALALLIAVPRVEYEDHRQGETELDASASVAIVSHACCALSQALLISQPNLLQHLSDVVALYSANAEIQRHVARCFANFALYEHNKDLMLSEDIQDVDSVTSSSHMRFNVVPTLLAMGHSASATPEVRRHITRAVDNLVSGSNDDFHARLIPSIPLITTIFNTSSDADTRKRASSVLEKLTSAEAAGTGGSIENHEYNDNMKEMAEEAIISDGDEGRITNTFSVQIMELEEEDE